MSSFSNISTFEGFWKRNDSAALKDKVKGNKKNVLYVLDNAGEDILDFPFINELLECGHSVTLAAKSLPVANDTTKAELQMLLNHEQIRKLIGDKVERIRIIGTGSIVLGTDLARVSEEFYQACMLADVIIFKGQGSYFTVRDSRFKQEQY